MFVGTGAGAANTSGLQNTFVGTDAGVRQVVGVKYRQLTTVLVNAANEQQYLIEQQQKQIAEQQRQIDALLRLVCGQNPAAELCSESRAARHR